MHRDLIAIGGSAGSLDTFLEIAAALPADFTGNLFITVHIGSGRSQFPALLTRAGKLPALHPRDGERIAPGHIYVAPPDRHLLVEPGLLRLSRGPREHFTRPAIDPLFRSAAAAYRDRVIGVVLSGGGSDGAAGLDTIQRGGGIAVVLDPEDAVMPDMPQAALEIVEAAQVVPAQEIPALLVRLSRETVPLVEATPPAPLAEPTLMTERPSALTCPECGGALRPLAGTAPLQYRCHIGHVFGGSELSPAQLELVEKALDTASRVLNERIELARQMAENAKAKGHVHNGRYWRKVMAEAERQAEAIRQALAGVAPNGENGSRAPEPETAG